MLETCQDGVKYSPSVASQTSERMSSQSNSSSSSTMSIPKTGLYGRTGLTGRIGQLNKAMHVNSRKQVQKEGARRQTVKGVNCYPYKSLKMIDNIPSTPPVEQQQIVHAAEAAILDRYFQQFEGLKKAENWDGIVVLGEAAIHAASVMRRSADEAQIHAHLASTYYYKGDYAKCAEHADRCRELAAYVVDCRLLVRSQYLQSAAYRALAGKAKAQPSEQKRLFDLAVATALSSLEEYQKRGLSDGFLIGKIYFNLGAAYADNPSGNLEEAARCYEAALARFQCSGNCDDTVRTAVRLAKVKLLQSRRDEARALVEFVYPKASTERIRMQVEYLEAQIAQASNEPERARQIAQRALERARKLGAKEDVNRLQQFLSDNQQE